MNRAERRRCNHLGVSNKMIMDKTLSDVYEQGVKDGMKSVSEIVFYMAAYTINYKLGFGKERLPKIMEEIYSNIDAYRTKHLTPSDYNTIVSEMNKLGVCIK